MEVMNMLNIYNAKRYCCEDISLIENYEAALKDKTQTWHCHHRAEILPCGRYSQADLKKHGLFFNVPASQLVFLTRSEHFSLHKKGVLHSSEHRRKISESEKGDNAYWFGRHFSEEHRRRISEGVKRNLEARRAVI